MKFVPIPCGRVLLPLAITIITLQSILIIGAFNSAEPAMERPFFVSEEISEISSQIEINSPLDPKVAAPISFDIENNSEYLLENTTMRLEVKGNYLVDSFQNSSNGFEVSQLVGANCVNISGIEFYCNFGELAPSADIDFELKLVEDMVSPSAKPYPPAIEITLNGTLNQDLVEITEVISLAN